MDSINYEQHMHTISFTILNTLQLFETTMKLLCKLPISTYVTDLSAVQALKVFASDVRIICTTKPLCADIRTGSLLSQCGLIKFNLISVDQREGVFFSFLL